MCASYCRCVTPTLVDDDHDTHVSRPIAFQYMYKTRIGGVEAHSTRSSVS